jgi:hypothetical protein
MAANASPSGTAPGDIGTPPVVLSTEPPKPGKNQDIYVVPEKLASVANLIEGAADKFEQHLKDISPRLTVPNFAQDNVTMAGVQGWNRRLSQSAVGDVSHQQQAEAYLTSLRDVAAKLRHTAELYQKDEEEKTNELQAKSRPQ